MAHTANNAITKFLFTIMENTENEARFTGIPYHIFVTSKLYFTVHHQIQSEYNKRENATLMYLCAKYKLEETFESCYYCKEYTAEELKQLLETDPAFEYSDQFTYFINHLQQ